MIADAKLVRETLRVMEASVGSRKHWCRPQSLPYLVGDPDIVAYEAKRKQFVVAEVEGASSGQPEQKLYKAIGQIVRTASNLPSGWRGSLVIVVYGEKIANHLKQARALAKLGIRGLALADDPRDDWWLFGKALPIL